MKKKVLSRITAERFTEMFPTIVILQEFMSDLGIERAKQLGGTTKFVVEGDRLETSKEKNSRELESVKLDIPALINFRDSYPEGHEKREDANHQIYVANRKISELEEKIVKEKPIKFVMDVVKFSDHEEHIETFDALAEEIGAWFSTGVLGKGTIEYNSRTFTAE